MAKKALNNNMTELKLATIIVVFAMLGYASPTIWNRYDNTPVIAAEKTGTELPSPKPKPEYVVKSFFYYLDTENYNKAFSLMKEEVIKYDQKIWEEDFRNIYFIKLRTLDQKEEKEGLKTYFVRLDVRLKGGQLKTNWKNGSNERLVTIELSADNLWEISNIK